jgi:predicted membrane-bound spermidine synthase
MRFSGRLIYFLFFLSGASGLIYEVVWVREFGNVFGSTVYSASLVVAVFMSGLGFGAYLAGRWADRRYLSAPAAPLRAYGWCELAIAGMGVLIALTLPRLGALSALVSSYTQGAHGWYYLSAGSYLARYAVAVLLLAPITLLMGATLTLLIRHLIRRDVALAGWKIGALYGINTAGAAAGAFFTDYALIPGVGLQATQLLAVFLNLIAALGALRLAADWTPVADTPVPRESTPEPVSRPTGSRRVVFLTGLALLLSGFAAMGMEILWFRHTASLLGSFRSVFSLLLTVILVGIWLGALAGGYLDRRLGRPAPLYMVTQALFAISALLGIATADVRQLASAASASAMGFLAASGWKRAIIELWFNMQPVLREVFVPAFFMGFTYPLANATIQRVESAVGTRAGLLYLANTVGAVLGALVTGLLLLPTIGMQQGALVLGAGSALAIVALFLAARPASVGAFVLSLVSVGVALAVWAGLPSDHVTRRTLALKPTDRLLTLREGVTEIVAITDAPQVGRTLITNGHLMSGTSRLAQRYMRAFAHLPLLSLEAPEDVLVIAFGVGNTAHAVSLHPTVQRLEIVDLSEQILRHAHYFSTTNGDILRHPTVDVYVNDGRLHLRMRPPATYDLITLEPPPIGHAGVAALYSREFLELARSRLKPQGYLTLWLPAYQVPEEVALSMVRAFLEVFPKSVLLSGALRELILMGVNDSRLEIDPARVQAKLDSTPALQADMASIDLATLTEIVGTFAGSAETLAEATEPYPSVTDDRPILEHATSSRLIHNWIPIRLFNVRAVGAWCPRCFANGKPLASLEDLGTYLGILGRLYVDPLFLEYSSIQQNKPRIGLRADPALERAVKRSPYLTWVVLNHFTEAR